MEKGGIEPSSIRHQTSTRARSSSGPFCFARCLPAKEFPAQARDVSKWAIPILLASLVADVALAGDAFRRLPDLDLRVFGCSPDPGPVVISSVSGLQKQLAELAGHCAADQFAVARAAFEEGTRAARIDWSRESLVVIGDWYGTGMARARLELQLVVPRMLQVNVVWTVPPPPVTPDTAVFRAAVAVDRTQVDTLSISGRDPSARVLPLAP